MKKSFSELYKELDLNPVCEEFARKIYDSLQNELQKKHFDIETTVTTSIDTIALVSGKILSEIFLTKRYGKYLQYKEEDFYKRVSTILKERFLQPLKRG